MAITTGGGSNFEEYIIHQVEMVIKTIGTDVVRAKTINTEEGNLCIVEFNNDKIAKMSYSPNFGFSIKLDKNGEITESKITSVFFKNLMRKIILFFETGEIDFEKEQTLAVMKLREAVIKSKNENESWVEF